MGTPYPSIQKCKLARGGEGPWEAGKKKLTG